jgi:peptidoglycan hydrolase-like amidase
MIAAAVVTFHVFGLFHPTALEVVPQHGPTLRVTLNSTLPLTLPDRDFLLRVPGRIERRFRGKLTIDREGRELIPVVAMTLETGVASIVSAESPPGTPPASLQAQAIVARSYLLAAGKRHRHSDFCDTTHCQFLRAPPRSDSPSAQAALATAGLVLRYDGRPLEALYSADCGGRTRTLEDARLTGDHYPYFPVSCPVRSGPPSGHRIGLCQRGAAELARTGATWRDILRLYYPAATVSR